MDLSQVRQEIDRVDSEIFSLLRQRMELSQKVAQAKMAGGQAVRNRKREEEVLARADQACAPYGSQGQMVYQTIFEVSRDLQHQMLGSGAALRELLQTAQGRQLASCPQRVVCQGVAGAYSHMAAEKLFPKGDIFFTQQFEGVFQAVERGEAQFGVVPVENSLAGSVNEVFDLIFAHQLYLYQALELPVSHCLAAKPGTGLADVRCVLSHHQGLAQCEQYCSSHGWKTRAFSNTAAAAQWVAGSGEKDCAAICSVRAAKIFGLEILEKNIQDSPHNRTRFIVVSRDLYIGPQADKISLSFTLPHVAGSLYNVLSRFALHGLSLTKIESRPIRERNFEYRFYVDFLGSIADDDTLRLLCALSEELPSLTVFGNYHENLA